MFRKTTLFLLVSLMCACGSSNKRWDESTATYTVEEAGVSYNLPTDISYWAIADISNLPEDVEFFGVDRNSSVCVSLIKVKDNHGNQQLESLPVQYLNNIIDKITVQSDSIDYKRNNRSIIHESVMGQKRWKFHEDISITDNNSIEYDLSVDGIMFDGKNGMYAFVVTAPKQKAVDSQQIFIKYLNGLKVEVPELANT